MILRMWFCVRASVCVGSLFDCCGKVNGGEDVSDVAIDGRSTVIAVKLEMKTAFGVKTR